MRILELYTGTKTYMFPNGAIATPEVILNQFPAILAFKHVIETDGSGEVCFAVQNLSAMRDVYNIDKSLNAKDAIVTLQVAINTPTPEPEPTAEERIAAAMEYQNLLTL